MQAFRGDDRIFGNNRVGMDSRFRGNDGVGGNDEGCGDDGVCGKDLGGRGFYGKKVFHLYNG